MFTYPDAAILLFAKPPVPGRVKTRLIPAVGEEGACDVHAALLNRVGGQLAEWQLAPLQLWMGMDGDFPCLFDHWLRMLQCDGNLGQRMAQAAMENLEGETQKILFLGSDCPVLTKEYLESALKGLDAVDVVLGPAEDGGYVLLAIRRYIPQLFDGIDWGTDRVLEQTRCRLREAQACWLELDTLWDVDRPEDLARYRSLSSPDGNVTC